MRSDRPRRPGVLQRRAARRAKKALEEALERRLKGQVPVNLGVLRPTNSYGTPDFVERGFYIERPFRCKDCGKSEVWTASQQKWWYETAKGDVWTVAVRCRACRRAERARKAEARRVHREGLARRRARQA